MTTTTERHAAFLELLGAEQRRLGIYALSVNIYAAGEVGWTEHRLNGGTGRPPSEKAKRDLREALDRLREAYHSHGIRNVAITTVTWMGDDPAEDWELSAGRGTAQACSTP